MKHCLPVNSKCCLNSFSELASLTEKRQWRCWIEFPSETPICLSTITYVKFMSQYNQFLFEGDDIDKQIIFKHALNFTQHLTHNRPRPSLVSQYIILTAWSKQIMLKDAAVTSAPIKFLCFLLMMRLKGNTFHSKFSFFMCVRPMYFISTIRDVHCIMWGISTCNPNIIFKIKYN